VQDENSISREKRAAQCSVDSKETALSLLGDTADDKYPIYMTGDSQSVQPFFSCVLSSSTVNLQHELSSPSHGNYLSGPTLHTLCTVLVDLDKETVTIYKGNPKNGEMALVLPML